MKGANVSLNVFVLWQINFPLGCPASSALSSAHPALHCGTCTEQFSLSAPTAGSLTSPAPFEGECPATRMGRSVILFLPCFLPPFQTPACLWQTALVCRASGSQGNAECWCPHFCFQGSKVPKSTVVANVLTPLLCRHHTLHKPEASSCPLCKCSPQDSTHSPCSSVTIHYSSQLLEQAYELTAEKQHHPYAMESCLRQKIKWNKIKDKTLPPNISCSPSLCHSSTRFTNSKLNYRSEKKDSYSPSENRSHTLPRTSDDQPQDQDSTLVIPACSASSDKATSVRGLQGTLPSSTLKIATRAHYTSSSWWTKAQQLQSS